MRRPKGWRPRLVIFDVDGTLTKVRSSWQFLHERLGTWDIGRVNAKRFHEGFISYEEWARLDSSLWRGISLGKVREIIATVPYVKGVHEVITMLRKNGIKVVLLSAGLSFLVERITSEVEVDYYISNELIAKDGALTGEVKVNVAIDRKAEALDSILRRFNVKVDECAAVGDDESMIPIFRAVALSVAFNPSCSRVEEEADVVVKSDDLRYVLRILLGSETGQRLS